MINLEFRYPDGMSVIIYDVHPRSQEEAIEIPKGATLIVVWLGTTPVPFEGIWENDQTEAADT